MNRLVAIMPCHATPPAPSLLDRLVAVVPEVVLVDDGMPTAHRAQLDALALARAATVLETGRRSGKGTALALGFAAVRSRANAVLTIDSDGQHPPELVPSFLDRAGEAELVIGNRFAGSARMPGVRRAANRIANAAVARTVGRPVPDSQCGMRLLRGRALRAIPFPPGAMESETRHLIACLRAGVGVEWVDIPAIYRDEVSAFRPLRDSARIMRWALRAT